MRGGVEALTEREKETLRLLLAGHDAKSIARELGLSVHTVNERLRDSRRKLGVASSREAARLLAQSGQPAPKSLGDKEIGVGRVVQGQGGSNPKEGRGGAPVLWLGGGMIVMSLIIVAVALSGALSGRAPAQSAPKVVATSPREGATIKPVLHV